MPSNRAVALAATALIAVFLLLLFSARPGTRNPASFDISREGEYAAPDVSADEARRVLRGDSGEIVSSLNEMRVRGVDQSAVDVFAAAWSRSTADEPTLNWADLDSLLVRFALAEQLVRAHVRGARVDPFSDVLRFGRAHLRADAARPSLMSAIYVVALAGDAQDVVKIERVIRDRNDDPVVFATVDALSVSCLPEASAALDRIRARANDAFAKSLIRQTIAQSADYRARRCRESGLPQPQ